MAIFRSHCHSAHTTFCTDGACPVPETRQAASLPVIFSVCAVFGLCLLLAACAEQDKSKLSDAELHLTAQQATGRHLYRQYCSGCHEAYSSRKLDAFSLKGLYGKRYLPSGQPANDDRVRHVIEQGRLTMPAFRDILSPEETEALMAYLHTL